MEDPSAEEREVSQGREKVRSVAKKVARRARWLALWAALQAGLMRFANLIFSLYIISAGLAVGFLSILLEGQAGLVTVSVLGFTITGAKTLMTLVGPEGRSVRLKAAQLRLRFLAAELSLAAEWEPDLERGDGERAKKLLGAVRKKATEVDQMALAIFAAGSFPRAPGAESDE